MKEEMQKITVEVPIRLLKAAKEFTKDSTAGTVREALDQMTVLAAQREFLKLKGLLPSGHLNFEDIRQADEEDRVLQAWDKFQDKEK